MKKMLIVMVMVVGLLFGILSPTYAGEVIINMDGRAVYLDTLEGNEIPIDWSGPTVNLDELEIVPESLPLMGD